MTLAPGKRTFSIRLKSHLMKRAHLRHPLVGRPGSIGHLPFTSHKPLEPGLGHSSPLDVVFDNLERPAADLAAGPEDAVPLVERAVVRDKSVVAPPPGRRVVVLDVAARFQDPISLFVQMIPILDAADQVADVDVVERAVRPRPLHFRVIDLEPHVGRQPLLLHGRDVGADDLTLGEGVAKVSVSLLLACTHVIFWIHVPRTLPIGQFRCLCQELSVGTTLTSKLSCSQH